MLALSIVNVATTISSVALCLSPYPDFHRIHKTKHTGEVRILPMIMLCCNSTMWGLYGVAIERYFPVVSINVFGALVATAFVAVFYRCTTQRATLNMILACTTAALLSVAIFTFLAKAEAVSVSPSQLKTALGYCAVTVKTCLFVSPLQTTKLVIRTKSSASLLVTMCVVNLITGVVWVLFALLSNDMFIVAPNALGVFLSII
ncbi:MtN3-like protein [Phytophthora cinnamomi]|uniref:MtN3-like protein n=1 Tax=Phytophthora cinnamomi TaxID=4785 RepID=UPI003559FC21|nr:MtN3-like protein [Phytophthora cinnamomi]